MRKYLIQDITPPGKKHVTHPHKTKSTHDDEEHPKKPHAPAKHPAHPAHATHPATPTHRAIHHTAKTAPKVVEEEEKADEALLPPLVDKIITPSTAEIPSVITLDEAVKAEPIENIPTAQVESEVVTNSVDTSNVETPKEDASDPRTMLVDKIIDEHQETEQKIFPHAPSYFNDAMDASLPAKAWHYSSNSKQNTSTRFTPPATVQLKTATRSPVSVNQSGLSWKTWIPWLMGIAIISVIAVVGLNYYSGVDVLVIQKHDSVPIDEKISVVKTPKSNELSFSVIVATSSVSREVPASEEKVVIAKASGKIVVYNTQLVVQRLIKNTRFQSPTGKIYRITDSINIPKGVNQNGKVLPGSIVVTVYADEAGPDYNSEPTDFTVPGLKGHKLFDLIYARSQGVITGGATGTTKSVSDEDLKQASDDLRVQLETKLRADARSSIASWTTQISYDSGIVVELSDATLASTQSSATDKAMVSQEGTIYLLTFDRAALTETIVKKLIPTYNGEAVSISNLESLSIVVPPISGKELIASEKIDISIIGTPSIQWTIDEESIKKAILGIRKTEFNAIMSQFPTVDRAKATIRPVWKTQFPADPKNINVEIVTIIPE